MLRVKVAVSLAARARAAVTRPLLAAVATRFASTADQESKHMFSEPHLSMHAGPRRRLDDQLRDSEMADDLLHAKYDDLRHELEHMMVHPQTLEMAAAAEQLNLHENLDEMAAGHFSAASVFPEFTPAEDTIEMETHRHDAEEAAHAHHHPLPELTRAAAAEQLNLNDNLDEMAAGAFTEASVWPEFTPVEDVLERETHRLDDDKAHMAMASVPMTEKPELTQMAAAQLNLEGDLDEMALGNFTESSAFPEFTPTEDILEMETLRSQTEMAQSMHSEPLMDLTRMAAATHLNVLGDLDEMAAVSFSEASVFPEYTPAEDVTVVETQRNESEELKALCAARRMKAEDAARELKRAQDAFMSEMGNFSEASDFPECLTVQEIMELRK